MRLLVIVVMIFLFNKNLSAQNYDRDKKCGTDTINIDYVGRKFGNQIKYQAFKCHQVSKLGVRVDLAYNHYNYNSNTKNWIGNHGGATFGIGLLYGDFTMSAEFKPSTVMPKSELTFNGQLLTTQAKLNPIKIEYKVAYSINTICNFTIEPYVAYTRNSFYVINQEQLNRQYQFDKIHSPTFGISINKYFRIKEFQFVSIFFKYGYSMTNYQKLNNSLGKGYNDISVGISYKGFIERVFLERIQ